MKLAVVIVIFTFAINKSFTRKRKTEATAPINDRIAALRFQLKQSIQDNHPMIYPIEEERDATFEQEYAEEAPMITPIAANDKRKKNTKYKLRILKKELTKKTTEMTPATTKTVVHKKPQKSLRSKHRKRHRHEASSETFYRRQFYDESLRESPNEWIHCHDLITPILKYGFAKLNNNTLLTHSHKNLRRLIALLNTNTSTFSQSEITEVMYSFSNMNIWLFQYDNNAKKALLNVLIEPGHRHDFNELKRGLKKKLATWTLNYSNVSGLLQAARMFKPPCYKKQQIVSTKFPLHHRPLSANSFTIKNCGSSEEQDGKGGCVKSGRRV